MMPQLSQMIPPGISMSSVPIENSDIAISDQTTVASSPKITTTLRELKSTMKTFASEGPHNFLPQMCVNGARFPKSL